MADQITFSIEKELVKLGKSVQNLTAALRTEINAAVKDTAYAVYASIRAKAQKELSSTRQDYQKALNISDLGDDGYLISLDGEWANRIETGWGPYDQSPGMLASDKTVSVGSRAGQPWVQHTQERANNPSHKFARVPFEHHPFSKAPAGADMAQAIKAMTATNVQGLEQRLTKIFKDESGAALTGKVAVARSDNPMLDQMTKYQHKYVGEGGKETIQATYMTYRTISEIGKPWINGGFSGLHGFAEAEKKVEEHIQKILATLLK